MKTSLPLGECPGCGLVDFLRDGYCAWCRIPRPARRLTLWEEFVAQLMASWLGRR